MNYWKVILATVVIFGAGVLTGGLMIDTIQHSHQKNRRPNAAVETHLPDAREPQARTNNLMLRPQRPPEILDANFVQQLDDKLQLTADQRASIQKIIAEGQERNHSIWTNNSAQMRAVIQDVRHRVREVLTADQQKQFEELMKRMPHRAQNTNAPVSLLAPPPLMVSNLPPEIFRKTYSNRPPEIQAIISNLPPETQVMLTKAYSNRPPEEQAIIIEIERRRQAERGTNLPSMISPPIEMGLPNAPAN